MHRPRPAPLVRLPLGLLAVVAILAAVATTPAAARAPVGVDLSNAGRCDFLDPASCLFPWPNDYFTVTDHSTDTRRRVNLNVDSMPRNASGLPVDPTDYNRADGFSPGQLIITKVPGLDTPEAFRRTGAVPVTDLRKTYDRDQPVVVINTRTRERHLIWSELDANPTDPKDVTLLIRPAVNFEEGTRYIVALRNLKDASGKTIPASPAFRIYRDRKPSGFAAIERRRRHFESLFRTLRKADIGRRDLFLAWDFTVASERSTAGRALKIRDDAFGQLGDRHLGDLKVQGRAPDYKVTTVTNFAPCGDDGCGPGEDAELARRVEGTFTVPCYLDETGCPSGAKFNFAAGDRTPSQIAGNTHTARFVCNIPRAAVEGAGVRPGRPSLYGHGLLGSPDEVNAGNVQAMSNEHNFVFCATAWIGMANEDIPNAVSILGNFSGFPSLTDRLQQGFVGFMYLGRLMIHPDGFANNAAFQDEGRSVIDGRRLFYDGNSQGGIFGGALTALAPDYTRAVLGVPGMNYSTLLRRSVDFDLYSLILEPAYPSLLERPLMLSMVQMLWDRSDANGYAHHMTDDPLRNTPSHKVLMHVALGDHQVAQVSAEVEARTIGAKLRTPAVDAGRSFDRQPFYGIPAISGFPFNGSAFVIWDSGPLRTDAEGNVLGNPPAPITNTPPREGEDPHGDPRSSPLARIQKSAFLRIDGSVIDVCGARPCYAGGWEGP
ncbi:MAG: hypothetical protein H0U84_09575 [Thermoleophilaceae bacterium]|nr:hypothetical protein [Thermoleophilaceae bacterium]